MLSIEPEFATNFDYFNICEQLKFHAQLSFKLEKSFTTSRPGTGKSGENSCHTNQCRKRIYFKLVSANKDMI